MSKPEKKAVLDLISASHDMLTLLEKLSAGDTDGARQVLGILDGSIGQQLRSATDRALLYWVWQSSTVEPRKA
jgi:hypothetical protein